MADRRRLGLSDIAILISMVLQLGALIWGAATLSENVKDVTTAVTLITADFKNLSERVNTLNGDVRILRDRSDSQHK